MKKSTISTVSKTTESKNPRNVKIGKSLMELIKTRLIEVFHPVSIYIFGSRAWGKATPESDLDIAIIIGQSTDKMWERIRRGTLALGDIDLSIDLLAYTREEFESRKDCHSALQYMIDQKGIKIYEAL